MLGLWKENGKVTILIDADGCPVVDLTIGNTAQFPPSGLSTAPAPVAGENLRLLRKGFQQHGACAVDADTNVRLAGKVPAPVARENIRTLGTALAPRRTVGNMLAKNAANQK